MNDDGIVEAKRHAHQGSDLPMGNGANYEVVFEDDVELSFDHYDNYRNNFDPLDIVDAASSAPSDTVPVFVAVRNYHTPTAIVMALWCLLLFIFIFVANRNKNCQSGDYFFSYAFLVWVSAAVDFALVQPLVLMAIYVYRMMTAEEHDKEARLFSELHPIPGLLRQVYVSMPEAPPR
jgi:hypothetical protein